MPTLVEVPLDSSMESYSDEPSQHRSVLKQMAEQTFLNESTRLLDESALGEPTLRLSQHVAVLGNDETKLDGQIDPDETRLTLNDVTNLGNDGENGSVGSKDGVPPSFSFEKSEAVMRTKGPKEEHYKHYHECYVSQVIADFQHRHPQQVRDYRSLSSSEKDKEQANIAALLSRLGRSADMALHCGARVRAEGRVAVAETSIDSSTTRVDQNDASSGLTDSYHQKSFNQHKDLLPSTIEKEKSQVNLTESHHSSALLTQDDIEQLTQRMDHSMDLMSHYSDVLTPRNMSDIPPPADDDDSSASSVELARRNNTVMSSSPSSHLYESPTIALSRSKRLASSSGKRGADISRMRVGDDSYLSFDASIARASEMISSPSQVLCTSVHSADSPRFKTSQSPIRDDNSIGWERSSDDDSEANNTRSPNDTLNSADSTLNFRRRVKWHDNSYLNEIPADLRLKEGVRFRMKPLRVGRPSVRRSGNRSDRRRRISLVSMPDPLRSYEGIERKKMKAAYNWMKGQDTVVQVEEGDAISGGVLFSMSEGQIMDVTMKLIVKHPSNHNMKDTIDDIVNGGTLIVARSKEDLEKWQSALRECTSYSVLNHATMTTDERKRTSTANRCAGYDIVVTTFDAMKSKDVTIPLDADGHVILAKIGFQDGWYSARSQGGSDVMDHCEQLSVLHQITWRRVVFVDNLGRKSYLAKFGTARANASVALSAACRFVFFTHFDDVKQTSSLDSLARSDRKAFRSVGAVLHLSEERTDDGGLSDRMFDMNHVSTRKKTQK